MDGVSVFRRDHPQGAGPTHYLVPDDDRGSVRVVRDDGSLSSQATLPAGAYELVTRSEVYDEVVEALEKLKMPKSARESVLSLIKGLPG